MFDLKKMLDESGDQNATHVDLRSPLAAGAQPLAPLRLVIVNESILNTHLLPESGALSIGRGPESNVFVPHPTVSRNHALLHVGAEILLEDRGSANGTAVNNVRISEGKPVPVSPSDVIRIGQVHMFLQREWESGKAADAHDTHRSQLAAAEEPTSDALLIDGNKIVVKAEAMQKVFSLVSRVATTNVSVLILGETGTGKEIIAHAIHSQSQRARGPFVGLNCAALAEPLLESELFGHEKGAFTGAHETKAGLFEKAQGGTLFLDEVGDMSLAIQAKLLRVFEERRVLRLGSLTPRPIDVRFVTATNRNLGEEVKAGRFRKDFYFRMSGVTLQVPPLRDRASEINPLARLFIHKASKEFERAAPPELSNEALDRLLGYTWPGNIRELRNVIERAVLLCDDGLIRPEHLNLQAIEESRSAAFAETSNMVQQKGGEPASFADEVESLERRRFTEALGRCDGNQKRAAELLGIPRRTFVRKLKLHGLQKKDAADDDEE
ncbi:MAG TPA: sigma 54-interacting transcriptional regulator [Planctomycetota bacterium]|nr:sigma 54-interacting transcriptional regulator [Planctomycetota bacterium]